MVESWRKDNVQPVVYFNPYLADLEEFNITSDLFRHGFDNNYFVKNAKNEVYFINSVSIRFAFIDLTNKDARTWVK